MEFDKDLIARQEARLLAGQAEKAQRILCRYPQEKLDAIVSAVAAAFEKQAGLLAKQAAEETGFGNPADKTRKNLFASRDVHEAIRDMKTVGILRRHPQEKLWEVGVPMGVIAAIVPSTNPTSTVCYKALIALKAGNSIVFFAPSQGSKLYPGSSPDRGGGSGGGRCASRLCQLPQCSFHGRVSGADGSGAGAADPGHRRTGDGPGSLFFRQACHRCGRGQRTGLYPPHGRCSQSACVYPEVQNL